MAKQQAPTLREMRKLAREVFGGPVAISSEPPWGDCRWWTYSASRGDLDGMCLYAVTTEHPHGPTARRMLHAALMAAWGAR